jgi:hypothetical protein
VLRNQRVCGPFSALTKEMSSATGGLSVCAVRHAEMEFRMYDI